VGCKEDARKQDKDNCQNEQYIVLPNVQAYRLFSEGKTPLEALKLAPHMDRDRVEAD